MCSENDPLYDSQFGRGSRWSADQVSYPSILAIVFLLGFLLSTYPCSASAQEITSENKKADESQYSEFAKQALTAKGDAERGKTLFFKDQRLRCTSCHQLADQGTAIGPRLDHIGGKFDRSILIESLLQPSKQIVEGYRTTVLILDDGTTFSGIVKSENESSITVVDGNGNQRLFSVEAIEAREDDATSLMPKNIVEELNAGEFTDLVAYLETLGGGTGKFGANIHGPINLPDGFQVETIATGITGAVALETLPDGRVLICEQSGDLRVVENNTLLPKPMVTLPVEFNWERGLIGVTVDPNFTDEPFIYVCYVVSEPFTHHVVSRWRVDRNHVVEGSEEVLLLGDDQSKMGGSVPAGHQGGAIHFGPDGCLYIGIGEQTAGIPSQQLDTFQGKLLRIHRDGTIPKDNPFLEQTTGKYQAIWARGLRNPFTFAFDAESGELLINDVGGRFEEINRGRAGANFGWPAIEHGPSSDDRFASPIHIYAQSSIGGGDFIPADSPWPSEWRGKYVFADFVQGWIKAIDSQTASPEQKDQAITLASGLRRPVDLRFGPDGSLYVLLRNAWVADDNFTAGTGSLLRISYQPK